MVSHVRLILRQARSEIEQRGLRHSWVAQKVGVSPSYLSHILAGRRPVPLPEDAFCLRVAEALSCDVAALTERAA